MLILGLIFYSGAQVIKDYMILNLKNANTCINVFMQLLLWR